MVLLVLLVTPEPELPPVVVVVVVLPLDPEEAVELDPEEAVELVLLPPPLDDVLPPAVLDAEAVEMVLEPEAVLVVVLPADTPTKRARASSSRRPPTRTRLCAIVTKENEGAFAVARDL